jgi:hypothetical protein
MLFVQERGGGIVLMMNHGGFPGRGFVSVHQVGLIFLSIACLHHKREPTRYE